MRKTFTLNTEPHVADIGGVELLFQPEIMGDEFLESYERLREAQRAIGVDLEDLSNVEPAVLRQVFGALRAFLASLMLQESAQRFARWDVVSGETTVGTFTDPAEAEEYAAGVPGARVAEEMMRLPDRVLVELLEWSIELYGGGRPPTSSSGSAAASPPPGKPGTAPSRSRASTRARGR